MQAQFIQDYIFCSTARTGIRREHGPDDKKKKKTEMGFYWNFLIGQINNLLLMAKFSWDS